MPKKQKQTEETVLTTTNETALALPDDLLDELAELGALDELDKEDRPLPFWIFNAKIKTEDESWVPKDMFFNTVTELCKDDIDCVLLHLRKTRRHAEYIEGVGTQVYCRSEDRIEGITEDGEVRACDSCPNKNWGAGRGRDAAPKCGIVYNLIGIDLEDQTPFIVRAKSTSLKPVQKYIARHFAGKMKRSKGGLGDFPLFVYKTRLSLRMPTDNYSVLTLENIAPCSEDEIREFQALYKYFKDSARVRTDIEPAENMDETDNADEADFLAD